MIWALLCMILWVLSSCRSAQNPVHSTNRSFYASPYAACNNGPSLTRPTFPSASGYRVYTVLRPIRGLGSIRMLGSGKVQHTNNYKR